MTSGKLYLRLLEYVRPYWRIFLVAVASMAVVAASEPAFPALLKPLLDGSFVNKDPASIRMVPPLLIGLFLLRGVFTFISAYAIAWVANRLVMDLRALMFHKMVNLPTRYYDNTSSGAAIANVAFNVSQVADAGTNVITVLVRDTLTVVGLLGWIFYLNWKLSLIALAIAPVIVLIVRSFSGRLRRMSRGAQHSMGDITHVLEESLEGHKVVKIFGGQEYEYRRFREAANRVRLFNMKQTVASAANVPLVQLVAATALAIIIYIATMQSAANQTTVGGFVSFITAMLMLLAPIKRLTGINESLQRGLAAAEIVFDLIDQPSEPDSGTIVLEQAKGELEFRQMSFNYEGVDAPALHDISLRIAPGETIALVGASGGGKTTLVNLIPLLYHPGGGKIFLDGHDIETIKLASLRDNIALVSQDVVLFNDTIAANIAYGRRNQASGAEIAAAAEAANAMEFISAMPQGLQTEVGENGVRLSGGQRQRIAIARALLKDAPILILDEATSALDAETEAKLHEALREFLRDRTTLIIAHRLSAVKQADRAYVFDGGQIIEEGVHEELIKSDGLYSRLYGRLQH